MLYRGWFIGCAVQCTVYSVFYSVCWDIVLAQWLVVMCWLYIVRCTSSYGRVWCTVHGVRCLLQYVYGAVVYSMLVCIATVWSMMAVLAIVYKSSCTVNGCMHTGCTNCVYASVVLCTVLALL